MASGKVHGRVTITLTPLAGMTVGYMTNSWEAGLIAALGCLVGLIMEPDLDVDHMTASERRLMRLAPLGLVWFVLWMPYARMVPHRHAISHMPVLGTLGRYLYLAVMAGVPLTLMGTLVGEPTIVIDTITTHAPSLAWLIVGTAISDAGHWVLDQ